MAHQGFQRQTRQRQVILEELGKLKSHPTAAALYELVRRRLPSISLGTVYRNLELLSANGLIGKLELNGAHCRFDGNTEPHDHIRCTCCDRVDDLQPVALDAITLAGQDWAGYEVQGRRLEFFGVCPQCRNRPSHQARS